MKEIKLVHIVIAVMLVLLSLAIVRWIILPKDGLPTVTNFSAETAQPEELPALPQNEPYNSSAAPSFSKDLPSFKETQGQDLLEPKDPAVNSKKAEL